MAHLDGAKPTGLFGTNVRLAKTSNPIAADDFRNSAFDPIKGPTNASYNFGKRADLLGEDKNPYRSLFT